MRRGANTAPRERGAILMFVLLVTLLLAAITLGVMQLIQADTTAGVREMQAVQAFNVAEAGVHYALGQLQASGSTNYTGETKTITSGATTLGTATITVNCIDNTAMPCSGTYAGYRRIVSVGTLTVGGPSRTVVAVVQATSGGGSGGGNNGYGVCAYTSVSVVGPDLTTIKSDIGSNGTIDTSQMSQAGTYVVAGVSGKFTGKAVASSTITCNGACSGQIQGGAFPSSSGTICSALTVPTFTPGATALNITSGYTMNSGTGYSWGNVTMPDSGSSGSCGNSYNTLSIQAGASGTNTVVQFNTLTMGYCTRLAVLGAGNIELRIGKATLNGITTGGYGSSPNDVHFGVTSADTGSVLAPLAAGQLTVWVNSNCTPPGCACAQNPPQGQTSCAAQISHIAGSAIFNVPNGSLNYDDSCPAYGTATAKTILFSGCAQLDASGFMSSPYTNFYNLRSWKDE